MNTAAALTVVYQKVVVPLDDVCRDYFPHLTPPKLAAKIHRGEIRLPLVQLDTSRKGTKGVHVADLARMIDESREAASHDIKQLTG